MQLPRSVAMDLNTGLVTVQERDGTLRQGQLSDLRRAIGRSNIRQFRLDFDARRLDLTLPNGRHAVAEIPWPDRTDADALGERRVVHLDQRDWSKLAAARHGVRPLHPRERDATELLLGLVDAEKIVLPASASHFVESDRLVGPNRVPLASTLLELSRGWHMLHPATVGRDELAAALGLTPTPPATAGVYTLVPTATFVRFSGPAEEFPEPFASIMPAVITLSAMYDAVVDDTPAPNEGADEAASDSIADQERLIALFEADGASREIIRRAALARQLLETGAHLVRESNLDPRDMEKRMPGTWLANAEEHVAKLPYLSRVSHLYFARFRNRARWRRGDLLDIHFLAAAAGYAHVVVGEKRTIGDLRTAKNVPPGAELVTSLTDAVRCLGA